MKCYRRFNSEVQQLATLMAGEMVKTRPDFLSIYR